MRNFNEMQKKHKKRIMAILLNAENLAAQKVESVKNELSLKSQSNFLIKEIIRKAVADNIQKEIDEIRCDFLIEAYNDDTTRDSINKYFNAMIVDDTEKFEKWFDETYSYLF